MPSLPIYYKHKQPLLMNDDDDDVAGADHNNSIVLVPSSTARGRPIARSSSASARRTNSSLTNNGGSVRLQRGGDPAGSENSSSSELAAGGNNSSSSLARIKRCQTAPGYVSFEDIFLCRDVDASQRRSVSWRDEEEGVISDPLVRKATQLYAGLEATDHLQPRHSRSSPGPLGTRRGSAMHWLAKKYVCPCLGFLTSVLFCGSEDSPACAAQSSTSNQRDPPS